MISQTASMQISVALPDPEIWMKKKKLSGLNEKKEIEWIEWKKKPLGVLNHVIII